LAGDFLSSRYEGIIVGIAIAPAAPIAALLMKSLLLKIISSDYMVLKCMSGYFHSSIKIKQYCCMGKSQPEKTVLKIPVFLDAVMHGFLCFRLIKWI
jgi:hypothetical protein